VVPGAEASDECHRFPGMLRDLLKGTGATEGTGTDLGLKKGDEVEVVVKAVHVLLLK